MAEQPTTPTPEAIEAVAAQDMPLPAPPGTGEVARLDPFPLTADRVEHVPPVRDNGTDQAPASWAPAGANLELLQQVQEQHGCGTNQQTCEQAGTSPGACRCLREVLGSAGMMGITSGLQVLPPAPNNE